jgi:hypothetical protein
MNTLDNTTEKKVFNKKEYDRLYMKKYRQEKRQLYLEKQKNQYEKNKEKRKLYQREYDRKKRQELKDKLNSNEIHKDIITD